MVWTPSDGESACLGLAMLYAGSSLHRLSVLEAQNGMFDSG